MAGTIKNEPVQTQSVEHINALPSNQNQPAQPKGPFKVAELVDGHIHIDAPLAGIKQIDIADTDLILTLENGQSIVIPNGAIDAIAKPEAVATFSNGSASLYELLKHAGIVHPAKAGTLRLVSENIDANPPEKVESHVSDDVAPPAPIAKTGVGVGNGEQVPTDDGEVPATFVPRVLAIPSSFSSGKKSITLQDIKDLTGNGVPHVSSDLFTNEHYKIDPSGRADLPLGAYDPAASYDQLVTRSSPSGQATVERIYGTTGADNIGFNTSFSAGESQWSKTLHVTLSGFSSVSSIQIVFSADKIAQIPGFNITGAGVTRDSPSANSWHITPTTDMLTNGLDINIVYDLATNVTPVNFAAEVVVSGMAGVLSYDVTNTLYLTWRDAVSQDDFTVISDTGTTLLVLPSGGVGTEIFAYDGDDVINAGGGNDIIHAGAGDDTVHAGTGSDLLEGGLGADLLDGGVGDDTATYQNAGTGVVAALDVTLGITNAGEALGDTYASIENLTGSDYDDTLVGNADSNVLTGGDGDDVLIGGAGADTLIGGGGTNTASYIFSTDSVILNLATNSGSAGDANGDILSGIQNLTGGQANDTFISNALTQSNHYDGQGGNDTVSYQTSNSAVTASLTTGLSDVILTNASLGDTYTSIENLTGTSYGDTLIGDSASNVLTGNQGDDTLEGLAGADTFVGGSGSDTVSFAHSSAGVAVSLTSAFSVGSSITATNDAVGDTFSSIENLTGSAYDDTLVGGASTNVLSGGDGDDVLEGMGGADTLDGGAGNDTLTFEHSTSAVAVALSSGLSGFTAQGDATGATFSNLENITGSNFNDTLIGNAENNVLAGGDGDDVLEGLGGADSFDGGSGTNTVSYEHSTDNGSGGGLTVSLTDNSLNTGDAVGDTFSNVQNLTGSEYADVLYGDAGNNVLMGGSGDDTLDGMAGTDTLYGGDGDDILQDDLSGEARIYGGSGDDTVITSGSDTSLDVIDGGDGADTLQMDVTGVWRVQMYNDGTGSVYASGAPIYTTINSIENITMAGAGTLWIYPNIEDNVIIGGSTGNDFVYYDKAIAGINLNLSTGVVTGGSGNDTLIGIENVYYASSYNDVLVGDDNNNYFGGGRGSDYIDGGAGIDTARFDDGSTGSVTVSLMSASVNTALGISFTNIAQGDVLFNIENLIGSNYNDFLYGNAGANTLNGNGGDDVLEGMAGADVLNGTTGTDTASYAHAGLAASGSETTGLGIGVVASLTTSFSVGPAVVTSGDAAGDTYSNILNLLGSSYDDTLIGNSSANVINGGDGNDVLEGLAGADTFIGGNGIDTVSYAHSAAGVIADLSTPASNTNDAAGDLYSSIENMVGSDFNDMLYGNSSDNVLDGGLGTNTLDGGAGTDIATYVNATGAMTINLATNTATGAGRVDTLVSIERIIGSAYGDNMTGTAGNDWLEGGLGADTINGGSGSDTVSYNSAINGISVTLGGANSEGDTLTSIENVYGSMYGDSLTGDSGNNIIEGGSGDDVLDGSTGTDTVSYENASAAVSVNISNSTVLTIAANTATGGEDTDTLSNFESILGSAYNDVLIGDTNANTINGGAGDDILVGGAGADTLTGGSGTDTVSYATASSAIAVTMNGTGTLGDAAGDILSGIENIIGSAYNDTITGDAGANLIDGGLGNDIINGGSGTDTVTYALAAAAVTVNLATAGTNVSGGAGSDALSSIENIIGSNYNDTITGDANANVIEGGGGNDVLNGGAGTDTLSYATASAAVNVNISTAAVLSIAAGTANGGAGSDTLSNFENITGSNYNDVLVGSSSANTLDGGAGDDTLVGGAGADTFVGGAGSDTVSYVNASSAVRATLGGAALTAQGDAVGDTFSSIENLTGSNYSDYLYGDSNDNVLIGGAGSDRLLGYDGNDILDLTSGNDTAYGGNGNDTFLVSVNSADLPTRIYGDNNDYSNNVSGDVIKLVGLTGGQNYSLANLAAITSQVEVLDVRDGVSSTLTMTSANIQDFVDLTSNNVSHLVVNADAGDVLNLSLSAGQSVQSYSVANGMDYLIFNDTTQISAVHWLTA